MAKILGHLKNTKDQLARITQAMYKQNLELAERNKTLTLLRHIDEVVLAAATDIAIVTQTIADLLIRESDFNLAAIYVIDKDKLHLELKGLAAQNSGQPALDKLRKNLNVLSLHPQADKIQEELQTTLGVKNTFACPLRASDKLIGYLILGTAVSRTDTSAYIRNLVERLTSTVSIAVENGLLYKELQEASARLRQQNIRLQELDKSKDEFISMASHQLRTPLTTIKGYLDMVLQGDVGPITKNERVYIRKAFDGAQKMVYLIGDLLNVSRLQSGKFVIENAPTNLAKLIEGEASQLEEEIDNKKLKFSYHKPDEFPVLNLDATKIRQVVMNFLDNAIHYTPASGSITVDLHATDKEITFTVTDTGIGVPAHLQHQLFTKFYRADNARKVRPDGTGLGLFMAKKVVAAQGGAIIFKSTEGKGSAFGFSFPRAALEIKPPKGPPADKKAAIVDKKPVALAKS